jgi:hypothetical protein
MSRGRGGYIGFNRVPAAAGVNSAASGVWTLREAEALKRAGTWPFRAIVPTEISGLQLWLDAADASTLYDATTGGSLVAADGGVARWEDKSGNARHATQATAANRPARKTAVQGGRDVLRFDGSNDFLSVPSSTATFKFLHSADSTVFAVFKSGTTANPGHSYYAILYTFNSQEIQVGYGLATFDESPSNDAIELVVGRGVSGIAVQAIANNGFPSNVFGVASFVTKPTDGVASNRASYRRNGGSAVASNTATNGVSTANSQGNLTIGNVTATFSTYLNGDIAEIIVYNSALSDANRALVEQSLIAKWGLT